jgi:chaperonin GroES
MVVGVGDRVLLPEYGGQKVKINEQEFYIYRDTEIVGKLE